MLVDDNLLVPQGSRTKARREQLPLGCVFLWIPLVRHIRDLKVIKHLGLEEQLPMLRRVPIYVLE